MRTEPTAAIVERLLAENGFPLISLYMPTHRAGPEIWQDQIRFKNLLRSVKHDLEVFGAPGSQIDGLLEPLVNRLEDRKFWEYQADGLALFRSSHGIDEFRLPAPVPELCVTGTRFHVKPLLLPLAGDQIFFVLALSQHAVRLFRGSPHGLREVHDLNLPHGLHHKTKSGKAFQGHQTAPGPRARYDTEIDHKAPLADYCRRIDQALKGTVGGKDLVILAAVDYLATIYREVSSLRELSAVTVSGNPDKSTADQLFRTTMPLARTHFDHHRLEAQGRFLVSRGAGKTLDNPRDAFRAARGGRIETLCVPVDVQIWGEFTGGEVHVSAHQQPGDQDLLNLALIDTWKFGGHVLALPRDEMPEGRTIAAITRF